MEKQKNISEIVKLWRTDKKQYVKKSSYAAYMLLIENHLLPVFRDSKVIEEVDVQAFVLKKLEQGLSQKTVKDMLIVLKMILKFGAKNQWIEHKQFDIQFPTERDNPQLEVLSRTNQKKIMNYIQEHFTFRNLGVYICLSSGMRIGEICALTWEDIDVNTGIISVRRTIQRIYTVEDDVRKTELVLDTPKTKNSIRDIPISRDLLRILKPIKKVVNNSFFVQIGRAHV